VITEYAYLEAKAQMLRSSPGIAYDVQRHGSTDGCTTVKARFSTLSEMQKPYAGSRDIQYRSSCSILNKSKSIYFNIPDLVCTKCASNKALKARASFTSAYAKSQPSTCHCRTNLTGLYLNPLQTSVSNA
jgi:hypothetical protein